MEPPLPGTAPRKVPELAVSESSAEQSDPMNGVLPIKAELLVWFDAESEVTSGTIEFSTEVEILYREDLGGNCYSTEENEKLKVVKEEEGSGDREGQTQYRLTLDLKANLSGMPRPCPIIDSNLKDNARLADASGFLFITIRDPDDNTKVYRRADFEVEEA